MTLRVLIVDDHQVVSDGLGALVSAQPDMTVVGCTTNGRLALIEAKKLQPDVIILDVSMPEMNGIDAAHEIHNRFPDIKIIILTMHSTPEYIHRALKAGAMGYLVKRSAGKELVKAIEEVSRGKHYFSESVVEVVVHQSVNKGSPADPLTTLSVRERQVLQLLAESKTVPLIAELLSLSPKTIETYRARIYEKLNLCDLPQLVRFAIKNGLTSLE